MSQTSQKYPKITVNQEYKSSFVKQEPRIIKAQDGGNFNQSYKYQSPQQNFSQYKSNVGDFGFGLRNENAERRPYQENNYRSPNVDKSILDSVMKQTNMKRENDMVQDLSLRLQEEQNMGQKLKSEIQSLQAQLEREKMKLDELDHMLSEELKRTKIKENDVIQEFHEIEAKKHKLNQEINREEDRKNELGGHIDNLVRENDMLKNELKRFGEMTSEKILELENGINNIGRMKDFEKENFNMEKDKIMNHCEFVLEQIKTQSNEREMKIQEELKKTQQEQSRADREYETINIELRNFDGLANQQINNTMRQIIEEESSKQKDQIAHIDDQIREHEHEINRLNTDNQKIIQQFQEQERDFKSKLINLRNRNTRLKEEFSNLEDEHNKLIIRLKSDSKEINNKTIRVDRLQAELDDVINKSNLLEQNYRDEIEGVQQHQDGVLHELSNVYQDLVERERNLQDEIRNEATRLQAMERKHHDMLEELQNKLNSTLNN